MTWLSTLASVGMAVGAPLAYVDQTYSMAKKKDATGFSRDVCAILLIANITRCFFWLGKHFEFALLLQSILMILGQLILLYVCILYKPRHEPGHTRPFNFWHWSNYSQYIEFLAGLIVCETILQLILGRRQWFIDALGYIALGLESTLPIPQVVSNYRNKSLYGFRMTTLLAWLLGDTYKCLYFFLQGSPLQFKACSVFQLSVDCIIVMQRIYYGNPPPAEVLPPDEDVEAALRLDSDLEEPPSR